MGRCHMAVLDHSGHLSVEWDPNNEAEVAGAREEVERLRSLGYSFFLTSGEPADEVAAGRGKLSVRRVDDPIAAMAQASPDTSLSGSVLVRAVHTSGAMRDAYIPAAEASVGKSLHNVIGGGWSVQEIEPSPTVGLPDAPEPPEPDTIGLAAPRRRGRPPKVETEAIAVRPMRGG